MRCIFIFSESGMEVLISQKLIILHYFNNKNCKYETDCKFGSAVNFGHSFFQLEKLGFDQLVAIVKFAELGEYI